MYLLFKIILLQLKALFYNCLGKDNLHFQKMSKPLHSSDHGIINYIDTKAKYRQQKNLLVKGLCGRCLQSLWRYSQSCWYFRPSFVNCCPSNLLCGSSLSPSSLCQSTVYIQTVCGWKGVGSVESCWRPYSARD